MSYKREVRTVNVPQQREVNVAVCDRCKKELEIADPFARYPLPHGWSSHCFGADNYEICDDCWNTAGTAVLDIVKGAEAKVEEPLDVAVLQAGVAVSDVKVV